MGYQLVRLMQHYPLHGMIDHQYVPREIELARKAWTRPNSSHFEGVCVKRARTEKNQFLRHREFTESTHMMVWGAQYASNTPREHPRVRVCNIHKRYPRVHGLGSVSVFPQRIFWVSSSAIVSEHMVGWVNHLCN